MQCVDDDEVEGVFGFQQYCLLQQCVVQGDDFGVGGEVGQQLGFGQCEVVCYDEGDDEVQGQGFVYQFVGCMQFICVYYVVDQDFYCEVDGQVEYQDYVQELYCVGVCGQCVGVELGYCGQVGYEGQVLGNVFCGVRDVDVQYCVQWWVYQLLLVCCVQLQVQV